MTYLRSRTMRTAYSRSASASALEKSRGESMWKSGTVTAVPKRTRRTHRPRWTTCSCVCVTRSVRWSGAAKSLRRWSTNWPDSWRRCRRGSALEGSRTVSRGAHGFRIPEPEQASYTAHLIFRECRYSPTVELVSLHRHSHSQALLVDHLHANPALDPPEVLPCVTRQLTPVRLALLQDRPRRSLRTPRLLRVLLETPTGDSSVECSTSLRVLHQEPLFPVLLLLLAYQLRRLRL